MDNKLLRNSSKIDHESINEIIQEVRLLINFYLYEKNF